MSDTARIPDDEWKIRARLGRAFGIWMGGLDGPAPSVEELEAWAKDAARLRDVDALRRLEDSLQVYATGGTLNALSNVARVLDAAATVAAGVSRKEARRG